MAAADPLPSSSVASSGISLLLYAFRCHAMPLRLIVVWTPETAALVAASSASTPMVLPVSSAPVSPSALTVGAVSPGGAAPAVSVADGAVGEIGSSPPQPAISIASMLRPAATSRV